MKGALASRREMQPHLPRRRPRIHPAPTVLPSRLALFVEKPVPFYSSQQPDRLSGKCSNGTKVPSGEISGVNGNKLTTRPRVASDIGTLTLRRLIVGVRCK